MYTDLWWFMKLHEIINCCCSYINVYLVLYESLWYKCEKSLQLHTKKETTLLRVVSFLCSSNKYVVVKKVSTRFLKKRCKIVYEYLFLCNRLNYS